MIYHCWLQQDASYLNLQENLDGFVRDCNVIIFLSFRFRAARYLTLTKFPFRQLRFGFVGPQFDCVGFM
jgi:hypothetical protein